MLIARVRGAKAGSPHLNPQSRRHIDLIRMIRSLGNVAADARILDVGCGTGGLAQKLRQAGFTRIWGADWLAPEILAEHAPGVFESYRRVDLNEAGLKDFESGAYDCVVCSDVLEHLERPAFMLRELARVTRPGGCIYVTLPNAFNYLERLLLLLTGNSKRYRTESPGEYGHISLFPSNVLTSLLNRAGLKVLAEGRGFAAVSNFVVLPGTNFGPSLSYCRYYCLVHSHT